MREGYTIAKGGEGGLRRPIHITYLPTQTKTSGIESSVYMFFTINGHELIGNKQPETGSKRTLR